jgi:bifunctional NMN adenylyltransferase/nudix hydrolase
MKMKMESYDVGVIVGRFQVHELHEGHRELIQTVLDNHTKVVVFLGLANVPGTFNNPLDFEARKQMILETFPQVSVLYIKDMPDDAIWSARLDGMIHDVVTPRQSAVLYGGRESFIARYHGQIPTRELESESYGHPSGTEIRRAIANEVKASADFRRGVIWATSNRYPEPKATVDVAIWSEDETKLLLGRKPYEDKFRLIGGFATPESKNWESDAGRELSEEAGGMNVTPMKYVGSFKVDDWRYRGEIDKIKTTLFECRCLWGAPRAGDDIAEVRWFDKEKLRLSQVVPTHHEMLKVLLPNIHD